MYNWNKEKIKKKERQTYMHATKTIDRHLAPTIYIYHSYLPKCSYCKAVSSVSVLPLMAVTVLISVSVASFPDVVTIICRKIRHKG